MKDDEKKKGNREGRRQRKEEGRRRMCLKEWDVGGVKMEMMTERQEKSDKEKDRFLKKLHINHCYCALN